MTTVRQKHLTTEENLVKSLTNSIESQRIQEDGLIELFHTKCRMTCVTPDFARPSIVAVVWILSSWLSRWNGTTHSVRHWSLAFEHLHTICYLQPDKARAFPIQSFFSTNKQYKLSVVGRIYGRIADYHKLRVLVGFLHGKSKKETRNDPIVDLNFSGFCYSLAA